MLSSLVKATLSSEQLIKYVGGYTTSFIGSTSDITVTFGGNLTGGIDTSASAGDMVLVYFGVGSDAGASALAVAGYTGISSINSGQDGTVESDLLVAYKFMGVTPDTSFVLTGGTKGLANAGAVVVQVWRNVDTVLPLATAATSATANNTVLCNPPSVATTIPGSIVVSGGVGGHTAGAHTFSSFSLSTFLSSGISDSYDATIGVGYAIPTTSSFNPAAFTFSGTDSTTFSYCAVTLALQPVYTGSVITFIAQANTQTSTASTSTIDVSKPAGTIEGDLMIMVGSCGTSRTWTGDTDWVELSDQNTQPALRIAYKVAGASEPSGYTFTVSSATTSGLSASILTYRNAVYDTIGTRTVSTDPLILPSVSPSASFSRLIAVGARAAASITLGTPSGMTERVTENDSTTPSFIVCDETVRSGATGTRSMSTGSTASVSGIMLAIRPL